MYTYIYHTYTYTYICALYISFFKSWEKHVDFKARLAFAHSNFAQV